MGDSLEELLCDSKSASGEEALPAIVQHEEKIVYCFVYKGVHVFWGCSSIGRAHALQA